ncbi:uncharacterized protein LOC110245021 [Exaiptasia diaphana]|uniref:Uncharacterized protein n=1 Tax=Exaiptasia diaphana TaxID=2652724 RepID=A0A913XN07_EXADI|nr:uncharacterized protein LOC110245021 [Exaiptasia diaphana]KXJ10731.1 Vimentin-type intermediate filament-associated coiled-coil protein [Exaiptasia diaphana]
MSFSLGAIKEANSHIEALTKRNFELEEKVKELSHVIRKQNEAHAENLAVLPLRMKQTVEQKDEEIKELKSVVEKLRQEASEREYLLQHYKYKCKILDEVSRHRDALESVLSCLDLVQETEENEDDNSKAHVIVNLDRETELTNGYCQSERGVKEVPRPFRIDSGVDVDDNDVVAV